MLKMLGAACVIFSASAVGFGFSGNVRRQCAQLTALIEALTYLKSEMLYRRTPLPQALGMLAEHSADAAVGGLFAKARKVAPRPAPALAPARPDPAARARG